jgi:Zn-dependent peptidase ImmA (M78 family)
MPSDEVVERLALLLGCLPSYFNRPLVEAGIDAPFFRRRRAASRAELDMAAAYAISVRDIAARLDEDVELPLLQIAQRLKVDDETPIEEVERFAATVRTEWNLGATPVPNVVRLLEARGAVVVAVGAFAETIDAFSARTDSRPVVVLCSAAGAAARRRFDAAHELGHLLMHDRSLDANRTQEAQAHRFAAALLMPAEAIDPWLPRRSNQLALLEEGSRIWGVSMQALLYRAKSLGRISEDGFRRTMVRMSGAGWRKQEPVELGPPEAPQLMEQAIATLPAAGTSLERIADDLGYPVRRLARMLSVPDGKPGAQLGEVHLLAGR